MNEAVYLVDDICYVHLTEETNGFYYEVYDANNKSRVRIGDVELTDSHGGTRDLLAAAHKLAVEDLGLQGDIIRPLALSTLEQLPEARRAYASRPDRLKEDRSIRFIDSGYDELFRIPNGGTVEVSFPDRKFVEKCFYIDDYHMKAGSTVYHICQFAELLERNGGKCMPEPAVLDDSAAWSIGHSSYLVMQKSDAGWDYGIYDLKYREIDSGSLTAPKLDMLEAREQVLLLHAMAGRVRIRTDHEAIEREVANARRPSVLSQLKSGNADRKKPRTLDRRPPGKEVMQL